ncbi:myosin light chain kinase family member 4-like, partial [Ruditapes philippinarum]|uniref:myosin light chain kinase family member 4-like n=1 Tax=Ruditapes philippinarum TaxID=129788 RepID=UPI00295B2E09
MSIPYEFVDLNENRMNISGHVIQPSDVQPQTAHSSTNEVSLTSQKQNPQGKQPVPKGFTTHPTLDNLNQLPNPKLHDEKSKSQVPATTTDQARKTFTEGPSVLLTDEANAEEFGVDLKKNTSQETFDVPSNRYTPGMVKSTGDRALVDMVNDLPNLIEETGCIVDKTCVPGPDCYEENVHFVRRKCLGRGSFGEVSLCEDKITQKLFVIKQVSKNKLRSSEIIVPSKLKHLNLTGLYGLIQRAGKDKGNPTMELLLEYCGLSIKEYYKQNRVLTDAQKWEVSKQGCAGLDHMSSNNIVHLDIKPENICIDVWADGSVVVKLTDFGSSRRLLEEPLKFVGLTPGYLAPEVCKMLLQRQSVRKLDITGKVDTFAFGLVIMFLYKGYHILVKFIDNGKQSLSQMQMKLIKLMADSRTEFVHDLIPDECDFKMRFLLRELTLLNHHDRFSAQQALGYIEEIAKDSMESENDPVEKRTKSAPGMELSPFKKCLP